MRQLTSTELKRIKLLTEKSVELTLIEPTKTGLDKSIMDATGTVRIYLKSQNIHDYEQQQQGIQNKIKIRSYLLNPNGVVNSTTSLYRPISKKGDPRIWFTNLRDYAEANDILAIIAYKEELFIINITKLDLETLLKDPKNNSIKEFINEINFSAREVADELLALLNRIAAQGAIPALLQADTAIGRTLETLLGININSSKQPDYKGIELKSFRDKPGNRKTLFAQVPDWNISKFKSSTQILDAFGYERDESFKLYCTVSSIVHNSQGLKLKLNTDLKQLIETSDKKTIGDFVAWELETLHKRLLEKHNETFWIAAESQLIDGREHFIFKSVEHTKKPIVSQFDILLDQGIITLDHLIKRSNGKVVEKGPLFKIKPNALGLLFPPSQNYSLL